MSDPEDEIAVDDIVGQITFVSSHPHQFTKEDMVAVMSAALVEILELRTVIGTLKRGQ